mmetsp:Transcript_13217/g.27463  ORF Transcript_13217/g.27463 Transcript_13217/m.27463 type:complete len:106 (+) Transcript_13217:41-358(+)
MSSASTLPSHRSAPKWAATGPDGATSDLPADYCRRLEELWQYNYNVPLARMVLGSDGQRYDISFQDWVMRNSDTQEVLRLHRFGGPHLCVFLGGQTQLAKTMVPR